MSSTSEEIGKQSVGDQKLLTGKLVSSMDVPNPAPVNSMGTPTPALQIPLPSAGQTNKVSGPAQDAAATAVTPTELTQSRMRHLLQQTSQNDQALPFSLNLNLTASLQEDDKGKADIACSPGVSLSQSHRSRSEGKLHSSMPPQDSTPDKVSKRESLKAQKRNYRKEKKRATEELLGIIKDPSVIVMADWLKVRGTLKSWTKFWCVLKPGLLLLYKSNKVKSGHWVGTVLLNVCELIERPSKKDGFCFKLFHPLDQSIWATKGPSGETMGAVTQPLPTAYLIFRAPSEGAGKCWMDALELALRCSSLLIRSMTKDGQGQALPMNQMEDVSEVVDTGEVSMVMSPMTLLDSVPSGKWSESDGEFNLTDQDFDDRHSTDDARDVDGVHSEKTDSESEQQDECFDTSLRSIPPKESHYVLQTHEVGQFLVAGESCQTEEIADENKSLVWSLLKQVRPGMDLSKVVLPTFILEPRSFLDKLTDYYYHADYLSLAVQEEDPFVRMKSVVQWYLSGFYKKPKGLKKPYNPILGEVFRCYWLHPNGTRTFYIAEQVSHHPPVSAFYVSNRQGGFCISGSVLARSKFYGNSLSAILDGYGRMTFLTRGEDYMITMPYAHCKGILLGTLTMELGGKVTIDCEKTGYKAELEFKLKPLFGGNETVNIIVGKIKLGKETLVTLDGHWDNEVYITDKRTEESELFWVPTEVVKEKRLPRYTIPISEQDSFESERLWSKVTEAIKHDDQIAATDEKTVLEEAQRKAAKERKLKLDEWVPRLFERDSITGEWVYSSLDSRPWDPHNDLVQFELNYIIQTKTMHKTPIVRTTSIMSVEDKSDATTRLSTERRLKQRTSLTQLRLLKAKGSGSSTPEADLLPASDSSESETGLKKKDGKRVRISEGITLEQLEKCLEPMVQLQERNMQHIQTLESRLTYIARQQAAQGTILWNRDWWIVIVILTFQAVLHWLFQG